jgi:L-aspartate oxidase
VFGRRAAKAIAGQRTGKPKEAHGELELGVADVDVEVAWADLRSACTEAMGIVRSPRELAALPERLEQLALMSPAADRAALELRSGAILARLMARAALLRTESRGVHHRSDHPDPVPDWAGVRLRIARTDFH